MARIRMIKPEFFDDPDVADLSIPARMFFIGLWTQADKEGRLVDDARRLKARIFPFDDVDVEALAVELHGKDMIRRYVAGEKHGYIWIKNFTKHQRPHPKEPASVIPPYVNGTQKKHGKPRKNTASPELSTPSPSESGVLILDSGIRNLDVSAEPSNGSSPPVLTFPTVGPSSVWSLSSTQLAEWQVLFPNLDVMAEMRKAVAWLPANPAKRKTAKGMPRFLVAWLTRAVDHGNGNGHSAVRSATRISAAPEPTFEPWTCPHVDDHANRWRCEQATQLGRPLKDEA